MFAFGTPSAPVANWGVLGFPEASSSYNFIYSPRFPFTAGQAFISEPRHWQGLTLFLNVSVPFGTNETASIPSLDMVQVQSRFHPDQTARVHLPPPPVLPIPSATTATPSSPPSLRPARLADDPHSAARTGP